MKINEGNIFREMNYSQKVPDLHNLADQYALPKNYLTADQNIYNNVRQNKLIYPPTIQNKMKETEKGGTIDSVTSMFSPKDSNPLMFTPPKVQDQQILHLKKKKIRTNDDESEVSLLKKKKNENIQSERDNQDTLVNKKFSKRILEEDNKDEFHLITTLDHSSSLIDKYNLNEDLVAEFLAMLESSNILHEEVPSSKDESSSSNDDPFIYEDEYPIHQNLVEKFSAMLGESNNFITDFSSDESSSSIDEYESSSSIESPFISEDEDAKNDDLVEQFSAMLGDSNNFITDFSSDESSSSIDEYESSSLVEEPSSTQAESSYMDESLFNCNKPKFPIVKLPVLLGQLNIDIDIYDSFDLVLPVSSVTKIDLSLHSLDCDVLLPTSNVFLKGVLIADIEYIKDNDSNSIHSQKITIPWRKVSKINWLHFPKLPSSYQAEYMFQLYDSEDVLYHREFTQQFAEKIQSELQRISFIWHDELISKGGNSEVDFQGKVNLSIFLLQSQYVDLNTL